MVQSAAEVAAMLGLAEDDPVVVEALEAQAIRDKEERAKLRVARTLGDHLESGAKDPFANLEAGYAPRGDAARRLGRTTPEPKPEHLGKAPKKPAPQQKKPAAKPKKPAAAKKKTKKREAPPPSEDESEDDAAAAPPARKSSASSAALPPTGGDSSSDDEVQDNRAAAADAIANDAPVHAPFKAPDPTRTVLFDDDDDSDSSAPPPPGSPRCVVCSTTQDVFIVERAQDLLRAEFYAWCCSSCARKYVKPRPDPKELCFATDDDEPLSPMKRTRLSF